VLQFISSPVSMVIHVTGQQGFALALQGFGLLLRIVPVMLVSEMAPAHVSEVYAVSGAVFYSVYILVLLSVSSSFRKASAA
jgi:uncharacterized protein (UPF0261 family)